MGWLASIIYHSLWLCISFRGTRYWAVEIVLAVVVVVEVFIVAVKLIIESEIARGLVDQLLCYSYHNYLWLKSHICHLQNRLLHTCCYSHSKISLGFPIFRNRIQLVTLGSNDQHYSYWVADASRNDRSSDSRWLSFLVAVWPQGEVFRYLVLCVLNSKKCRRFKGRIRYYSMLLLSKLCCFSRCTCP